MNRQKLAKIVKLHGQWLRSEDGAECADLQCADLRCANLRGADLRGADLQCADLRGAYLQGAYLERADLQKTCLDQSAVLPEITDGELQRAGLQVVGDYVWGWRTQTSFHVGDTYYNAAGEYHAPVFSVDRGTECHPGLYIAGLEWMKDHYASYRGATIPLVRVYCRRDELVHAGEKWRARRLWVYGGAE